jgi:PAS domain S-box-containing protein
MNPDQFLSLNNIPLTELLNGIPHGLAVVDSNYRLIEMNRILEAYTGYMSIEAQGVLVDSILKSNLGSNYEVFQEAADSGETMSFEGDIINRSNKKIPIQFTLTPLKNEQGNLAGFNLMLEDVSYLQAAEKKGSNLESSFDIIGHSHQMQEIFELMPVLAQTDASILITGQTGTGKDLLAEAIHKKSKRARHPFIKINCGALPEALLESELFGHVKGSFTGAVKDKPGMFRLAQEGTIFLTEIGDLPLPLQVKLLSVLDDKEFFPVGGTKKVKVDVRVIAATHRSLRKLVSEGKFREDLFYRLNVLRLYLPSLKERDGDIRLLLDHFFKEINTDLNKNIKGFTSKCTEILLSYAYPGNVRELRNIVEYAVNICQGKQIKPEHLPRYIFDPPHRRKTKAAPFENDSVTQETEMAKGVSQSMTLGWSDVEKEMIMDALKKTRGNRSEAAKVLGWGRTTLWRKINRYGLA